MVVPLLLRYVSVVAYFIGAGGDHGSPNSPVAAATGSRIEEAVTLEASTGTIHGTLLRPDADGPHPVVLLIAGSGFTDRNGNSLRVRGSNNNLALLAQGLVLEGIASVRYDKRGVGQSRPAGPKEEDLRFEAYVEDAGAWVQRLREDDRFTTVSIVGHSEGSLIGMLAAARYGADSFVSIAGVGRPAVDVVREQMRPALPPKLWNDAERILNAVAAGGAADSVPAELQRMLRPSVQPYLASWFKYDPQRELASLSLLLKGAVPPE